MTSKILGAALIVGAICGLVFLIKFVPVYVGNSELEDAMQECISYFETYRENGCRDYFKEIIEKDHLQLDPQSIAIDAEVNKAGSYVSAEYTQKIDFFGLWTYEHTFRLRATGKPPKRT